MYSNLGGEHMPNLKNAKKQVLINKKKEKANNEYSASMKTAIKNVERAVASKEDLPTSEEILAKFVNKKTGKECNRTNNKF